MNLPHLTPAEIEAELKGTEYEGRTSGWIRELSFTQGSETSQSVEEHMAGTAANIAMLRNSAVNAARAICLARDNQRLLNENEELKQKLWRSTECHKDTMCECKAELQAAKKQVWDEAIEAAVKLCWDEINDPCEAEDKIRALPNPYK